MRGKKREKKRGKLYKGKYDCCNKRDGVGGKKGEGKYYKERGKRGEKRGFGERETRMVSLK